MEAARHLRVVDQHGEVLDDHPEIVGLQHTIRSQAATIGRLKAELKPDQDHELFPTAHRLFDYWRERCNHPRSEFGPERFKEILPRLREHGEKMCRMAIDGAAYDPFVTTRKNGSKKRHDDLELVMRANKFEEFCNRAPHHLPPAEHVQTLADAILFLYPGMLIHEAVAEAQRRLA